MVDEIEYDVDEIVRVCRERENGGQRFTIICIAEGARPIGGEMSVGDVVEDSPDPIRLGGVGNVLRQQLEGLVRSEVRTSILGHIQRGGTPSAFDRTLATAYGAYAASMVAAGHFGRMVALQENRITSVPLEDVADRTRTVPMDAPMVAAAIAVGTSFGRSDHDVRMSGSEKTPTVS